MGGLALGKVVHEYASGDDRLTLCKRGFRATGAAPIEARWEDVAYMLHFARRTIVNGFARDLARLELGLASGACYVLQNRDLNLLGTSNLAAELVLPYLLQRMEHDFSHGTGAVISPRISVSPQGFHLREGARWALIPAERIAGYRIVEEHLLLDEDPSKPRLRVKEHVRHLVNAVALEQLLERIAPGRNLAKVGYRVRVPFWARSAATHDPNSMVDPRVVLGVLGVILLVGVVFVVYLRLATPSADRAGSGAFRSALAEIAPLPTPAAPLREACAGKSIAPEKMVLGFVGPGSTEHDFHIAHGIGWSRTPGTVFRPWMGKMDWVAAVKLLDGTTLDEMGTSHARAHVRITELGTGKLVCEGTSEGHWKTRSGESPDWGKTYGLARLAVAGLCAGEASGGCADSLLYIEYGEGAPPAAPSATAGASASASAPAAKGPKGKGSKPAVSPASLGRKGVR